METTAKNFDLNMAALSQNTNNIYSKNSIKRFYQTQTLLKSKVIYRNIVTFGK
jgi:hypothetical protein